jgi:hypothetical protein
MALSDFSILPKAAGNQLGSGGLKIRESSTHAVNALGGTGTFTQVTADSGTNIQKGAAELQTAEAAARQAAFSNPPSIAAYGSSPAEVAAAAGENWVEKPETFNALTAAQANANISKQVPSVSAATQNSINDKKQNPDHVIKLTQKTGAGESPAVVLFRNMPEVTESRTAEYEAVMPPQGPTAFQKYKGTPSVQWTVNANFTCRTTSEATENLIFLNQLRAWTMPYFGERTRTSYPQKLGAPPPTLILSGFRQQMIGPVPVVITSLNWSFPQDVDYIPANSFSALGVLAGEFSGGVLVPFPTAMKVQITLLESFATDEVNGFDLAEFTTGRMDRAWESLEARGVNYIPTATSSQAPIPEPAQTVAGAKVDPNAEMRAVNARIMNRVPIKAVPVTESKEVGAFAAEQRAVNERIMRAP